MRLAADTVQRLHDLRRRVRLRDARPNDGRCGNVSAAVEREFGWPRECGFLQLLDGTVGWVHCWNRLASGDVVDVTADQFGRLWIGDIAVLAPEDPLQSHYLVDPRDWSLALIGPPSSPQGLTCRRGTEVRELRVDDSQPVWASLAREALRLLTGWSLDDPLVDVAARALRAGCESRTEMSTAMLTRPLVTHSIQHLGRQGSAAWIAPEFADPL